MPKKISMERVQEIIKLNDQGYNYHEISGLTGISNRTVYLYVSKMNKQFYDKISQNHERERGRQLRLHMKGYRLCMEAFKKSGEDSKTVKVVKEKNARGEDVVRSEQTIKGQAGNTAHLAEARAHLAAIREIMLMKKVKEADDARAGSPEVTDALKLLDEIARSEAEELAGRSDKDR